MQEIDASTFHNRSSNSIRSFFPGGFQGLASLAVGSGVLRSLLGRHGFTTSLRRQHRCSTLVLSLAAATTDVLVKIKLLRFLAEFRHFQVQCLWRLRLCSCAFLSSLAVNLCLGPLAFLFLRVGPVGRSPLLCHSRAVSDLKSALNACGPCSSLVFSFWGRC